MSLKSKRLLSRRALDELGTLQAVVRDLAAHRNAALRIFVASRSTTTPVAQREFWLEFSWVDQEYRAAMRKLAQFCRHHTSPTLVAAPGGAPPQQSHP
jgi:DNA-binding transcriptional regulator WhiA